MFRLTTGSNSRDGLEPIDSKGNVLLGDQGNLDAASHVETLRTHQVLGFLFNQRGGLGPTAVIAEFDGNGQATNLQAMSASALYLASYARHPQGLEGGEAKGHAPFVIGRSARIRRLPREGPRRCGGGERESEPKG